MDGLLPRPIAHDATSAASGSTTWIDVVVRYVRHLTLSAFEREMVEIVRRGAEEIGAPLLETTSLADLHERLEKAALDPSLSRFNASMRGVIDLPTVAHVAASRPTMVFEDALGPAPARVFAEGFRFAAVSVSVAVQVLVELGPDALSKPTDADADPRHLFAVRGMPAPVLGAILDGLQAAVAQLAVAQAALTQRRLDPWLALALAERFRDGMRSHARFLAGLPGVNVPESLVAKDERLDVERLVREAAKAEVGIDQLAEQALASPDGVIWSGEPDDDG